MPRKFTVLIPVEVTVEEATHHDAWWTAVNYVIEELNGHKRLTVPYSKRNYTPSQVRLVVPGDQ